MSRTIKLSAVAALVLASSTAFAVDFNANIELDSTYRSGSSVADADKGLSQGGRVELNATGKAGTNSFVAGKAAFLAKKDGGAATDDMWVQVGYAPADIKLGRFEAADLFVLPQDTLVNHAGGNGVYGTNTLRGRKGGSVFHAAGTVDVGNGFGIEIGVVETKAAGESKGVRPVVSYAAGPVSVKLGFETGHFVTTGNNIRGVGATASYDFGSFKLTGDLASGRSDAETNNKRTAAALIATVGGFNIGVIAGNNEAPVGTENVRTLYANYAIPLFDIKGASVTPALSTSTAKNSALGTSIAETSFRLRFNYTF